VPKINITTDDGELVEQIDTNEYDTTSVIHRITIKDAVLEAVERAKRIQEAS
jgi:hypothetical protein